MKTLSKTLHMLTLVGISSMTALSALTVQAQDIIVVGNDAQKDLGLTLYSSGSAVVQEVRGLTLNAGRNDLSLIDLSEQMSNNSLTLSLGETGSAGIGAIVFPQKMLTANALLAAHLGKDITWLFPSQGGVENRRQARVISMNGGLILDIDGRVEVNPPGRPVYDAIPADLALTRSIEVPITVTEAGSSDLTLRYLTGGLSWQADYIGTLNEAETEMLLQGFATVTNASARTYRDTAVTLLAGNVNRVEAPRRPKVQMRSAVAAMAVAEDAPGAVQQARIGDFHRYDLRDRSTIEGNTQVRIALMQDATVPVTKIYQLPEDFSISRRPALGEKVTQNPVIKLSLRNDAENGLGVPLPAGTMRFFGGTGSTSVLMGEDQIDHVAEGQEFQVTLGQAFDISAERKQTAYTRLGNRGDYDASFEVTLENSRDEAVVVEVFDAMQGNWQVLEESQPHEKRNAFTPVWSVEIPAKGKTTLTYRVNARF